MNAAFIAVIHFLLLKEAVAWALQFTCSQKCNTVVSKVILNKHILLDSFKSTTHYLASVINSC